MEKFELILKVIAVIHRGFDVIETILKVSKEKNDVNDSLNDNIPHKNKS